MGGFSILHWLIVLLVLAVPIVVIVWLLLANARRNPAASPAQRLTDLDDLLRRGLISADEHRTRRADIIDGV